MKKIFALFLIIIIVVLASISIGFKKNNLIEKIDKAALSIKEKNKPVPFFSPIGIEYLRSLEISSEKVKIDEELQDGSNYKRYIASYKSEGNIVYGLLTIPESDMPEGGYPVIIFNHGYIPPAQYQTTEGYVAYIDYLAKNGFIVFKIDFRGNGRSSGDA